VSEDNGGRKMLFMGIGGRFLDKPIRAFGGWAKR